MSNETMRDYKCIWVAEGLTTQKESSIPVRYVDNNGELIPNDDSAIKERFQHSRHAGAGFLRLSVLELLMFAPFTTVILKVNTNGLEIVSEVETKGEVITTYKGIIELDVSEYFETEVKISSATTIVTEANIRTGNFMTEVVEFNPVINSSPMPFGVNLGLNIVKYEPVAVRTNSSLRD